MNIFKVNLSTIDLVLPLFDLYRQFYHQTSNIERARQYLSERLTNNEASIYVCIDKKSNPIGFVLLYPGFSSVSMEPHWILNDLYVIESVRREGVSRSLMETARQHCIDSGLSKLTLQTGADNYVAQNLYDAIGYEIDEGMKHYSIRLHSKKEDS